MSEQTEDPSSIKKPVQPLSNGNGNTGGNNHKNKQALAHWMRNLLRGKNDTSLREAIEEYIEDPSDVEADNITTQERTLLINILKLRDLSVLNVMIPRADIVAIEENISREDLLALLSERQYSRLPVYRETLDDVIGTIHLKDIVASLAKGDAVNLKDEITDIPIVSPSLPILDLLVEMQKNRRHMVMVVDEYGGIDGLVTIGDVIEMIVGEIDDEHDTEMEPHIQRGDDGVITVDARINVEDFEEQFGAFTTEAERSETDTIGGLVYLLAGRIPARGEILKHDSGTIFEVIDADPRRIKKIKIRNIPVA